MKVMPRRGDIVWRLVRPVMLLRLLSVMLLIIGPCCHTLVHVMLSGVLLMNRDASHVVHGRGGLVGRGSRGHHVGCAWSLLPHTHDDSWLVLVHHLLGRLVPGQGPGAGGYVASHLLVRPPHTLPVLKPH